MESKKDIGNYFKENLEQQDYSPSPKVWEGIEAELKKKKKRRFLFWMFFAMISVLGLSTYTYVNHSNSGKPSMNNNTTTDNIDSNNRNSNSKNINPKSPDSNSNIISNTKENEIKKENELANDEENYKDNLNSNTNSAKNNDSKKTGVKSNSTKLKPANSIGVVGNKEKSENNLSGKAKKINYKKGQINDHENHLSAKIKSGNHWKKTKKSGKSKSSEELKNIAKNNSIDALKVKETDAILSESEKEKLNADGLKDIETNPTAVSDQNKKLSLEDLKKANQKKRDSLVTARKTDKEKKDLPQKPKEEEKDSTKTEVADSGHDIIIAPYFGYNYNGNLGNGNFLNDSKTSKKNSQFQSSYGILVRWMGSEKMGIQTGIGIINSNYSATFEKSDSNFISSSVASLDYTNAEINDLFPNGTKVTSTQKSSFIEVPLEGYYIFSEKKFGIATSFGLSFLILQNNELFLESETVSRFKAGKLENIAPFSASANVKLNLFYTISKKLQFDLYPSIQYQIMGFKDVSNYHSYFFSIKTGLSYKL